MATRAPQGTTVDGATLTMHQAAVGDKISGITRPTRMVINNTTAGTVTLTVTVPGKTNYNVANPAKPWTLAVGLSHILLLPSMRDPADSNLISLTWSATPGATLTFAVIG
ncbi:hypothetical protein ACWEJ6_20985 [Nonomuraea sp. NPDC004702]